MTFPRRQNIFFESWDNILFDRDLFVQSFHHFWRICQTLWIEFDQSEFQLATSWIMSTDQLLFMAQTFSANTKANFFSSHSLHQQNLKMFTNNKEQPGSYNKWFNLQISFQKTFANFFSFWVFFVFSIWIWRSLEKLWADLNLLFIPLHPVNWLYWAFSRLYRLMISVISFFFLFVKKTIKKDQNFIDKYPHQDEKSMSINFVHWCVCEFVSNHKKGHFWGQCRDWEQESGSFQSQKSCKVWRNVKSERVAVNSVKIMTDYACYLFPSPLSWLLFLCFFFFLLCMICVYFAENFPAHLLCLKSWRLKTFGRSSKLHQQTFDWMCQSVVLNFSSSWAFCYEKH